MRNGPDDDGFRARLAGRSYGNGNPFSRETDFPGFGVGGPRLQQEGVAFDKAGRFAGRGSPHDVQPESPRNSTSVQQSVQKL